MGLSDLLYKFRKFFFLLFYFSYFNLNAEVDPLDAPSNDDSPAIPRSAVGLPSSTESQTESTNLIPSNNQPALDSTPIPTKTDNLLDPFAPKNIEIIPEKSMNNATQTTKKDRIVEELLNDDDSSFKEAPLKIKDLNIPSPPPPAKLPEQSLDNNDQKQINEVSTEEIINSPTSSKVEPTNEEEEKKQEESPLSPSIIPAKDRAGVILENNNINKEKYTNKNAELEKAPSDLEPWEDPRLPITAECRAFLHLLKKKNLLILKSESAISKIDDTLLKLQNKSAVKNQTEIDRLTILKSSFNKRKKTFLFEKNNQEEKIIRRGCPGVTR